jgi:tetratricopeptide (TPR) repeat protein
MTLKNKLIVGFFLASTASSPLLAQRPQEKDVLQEKMFIDAMREKILENYEEATYLFNEILVKDPTNAAAHYELSTVLLASGLQTQALDKAKTAFELDPKNMHYGLHYSAMLEKAGDFKNAANVHESLVKQFPDVQDNYYQWAFLHLRAGKPDNAIKAYNALEARIGPNFETTVRKFRVYTETNKASKAVAELENFLKVEPNNVEAYETLAKHYEQNAERAKALEVYERLIKVSPNNPRANLHMAEIFQQRGDDVAYLNALHLSFDNPEWPAAEKVKALRPYLDKLKNTDNPSLLAKLEELNARLQSSNPNDPQALIFQGDLYLVTSRASLAADCYKRALALDPNKLDVWDNYLRSLALSGKIDELKLQSNEMIELYPNQALGYYYEALAAVRKGKAQDALNSMNTGIALSNNNNPMKGRFHALQGTAYTRLGNSAKASEAFEKAIAIAPDNAEVLYEYSYGLLTKSDDLPKAAELAKKATDLQPNNPLFAANYGKALYKQRNYKDAKKYYDKALQYGGAENSSILEEYGDLLYRLNLNADAVKYWKMALDRGGQSETLGKKVAEQRLFD